MQDNAIPQTGYMWGSVVAL